MHRAQSDILLLGGDLFHENRPSRQCMVKTMKMFRRHVFGDRPVQVEPTLVKTANDETGKSGSVNWQNEDMNIGLPVLIIHGNHDDPAGQGNYSALDELSTAGLVNYFGKQTDVQNVVVRPIILTKGTCKLAIYGIGNIKDERLHEVRPRLLFARPHHSCIDISQSLLSGWLQSFKKEKVHFEVPSPKEDYFHILVIHQNRAQKGAKNYIPTEMLPDFLNFVIWGHEHECLIKPEEVNLKDGKTAHLTQPGSTVQTSLIAVEAERKHMAYMDIQLMPNPSNDAHYRYRFRPVEHRSTRPFIYEEIVLANETKPNGQPAVKADEESVKKFLEKKVKDMIRRSEEEYSDRPEYIAKPLIRLKVEHTGFPLIAPRRFGELFAGDDPANWGAANPFELLHFWRRVREGTKKPRSQMGNDEDGAGMGLDRDDILEAPEIEDLVREELEKNSVNLEVLLKNDLFNAVNHFVDKEVSGAIKDMVTDQLKGVQEYFGKHAQSGGEIANVGDADLMEKVRKLLEDRQKQDPPSHGKASSRSGGAPENASGAGGSSLADSLPPRGSIGDGRMIDSDDDGPSQASLNMPAATAAGRGRGGRGRGSATAGRGSNKGMTTGTGKHQALLPFVGSQGTSASSNGVTATKKTVKKGVPKKSKRGERSEDESDDFGGDDYSSDDSGAQGAAVAKARPTAQAKARKTAVSSQQSSSAPSPAANADGSGVKRASRRAVAAHADAPARKRRRAGDSSDDEGDEPAAPSNGAARSAWGM